MIPGNGKIILGVMYGKKKMLGNTAPEKRATLLPPNAHDYDSATYVIGLTNTEHNTSYIATM